MTSTARAPEMLWAQRSSDSDKSKNVIFLTINAPELRPDFSLTFPTPSSLSFKGSSGAQVAAAPQSELSKTASAEPARQWVVENLALFGEIDTESPPKTQLTGKSLQVQLVKKELTEEYWPRLTKDKRVNFVKTDFERWVDEDEQDGAAPDAAFDEAGGMGGMGGMPGMGGMGGMPGMGGMGGMGGGGGAGFDMASMMQQMGGGGGAGGMDMEALMKQMKASGAGGLEDDDEEDELEAADDTEASPSATAAGKQKASEDEDLPPLEDA